MKKIISVIMICQFLSSSAYAETQTLQLFKEKIPKVAGFYAGAARFYYHAMTTKDTDKLQYEASMLLKEMMLELSQPEYKEAISQLRSDLPGRYPEDIARLLNVFLYVAENDADPSKIDASFVQQEFGNIIGSCFSYSMGIVAVFLLWICQIPRAFSSLFMGYIYGFIEAVKCIVILPILICYFLILWPSCLFGVDASFIICTIDPAICGSTW